MTITSRFYTGPVNNVNWASGTRSLGYRYMVRTIDDFKVTVNGAVTRGFSVSAGVAAGGGIEDTNDAPILGAPQALPLNATDRWWLIGLRRTWGATKATAVDWIAGTSAEAIPVRPETPGTEDFQPLALAFVPASGTAITTLRDLRVIADNGGTMLAFSDLVRDYINTPGTMLRITQSTGTVDWMRHYDASSALVWSSVDTTLRACRVSRSTSLAITNGVDTTVDFTSEQDDPAGMHSNTVNPSRITIPVAGWYTIGFSGQLASASTYTVVMASIMLNTSTLIGRLMVPGTSIAVPQRIMVSTVAHFDVGDYVETAVYQTSGASRTLELNGDASPAFWAARIGS